MSATFTIECTGCGAKFAGKPEYAGKRIRCPKCQEVFRVEEQPVVAAAVKPDPPVNSALDEEFDEWNVPADFEYKVKDDAGTKNTKCKYCGEPTDPEQVLCMNCGYHRILEKKIETQRGAEAFAEEAKATPKGHIGFGSFSLPILPVAIGGGVAALFALVLLIFAPGILALLCLLGGLLLAAVGNFWIIIIAFREDVFQGLLVWFVPIYWFVYVFSRWDETWLGFAVWGVGCALVLVAIGIISAMGPDDSAAWLMQSARMLTA